MSEKSTYLMFSYGTLKRVERNYDLLTIKDNGWSSFIGSGETVMKYPLVVGTRYNIPFIIDLKDQGHNIQGEIFEIDDKMLAFLDEFEGHPHFYRRQEIPISVMMDKEDKKLETPKTLQCWVYFLSKIETDMLETEWLKEFKGCPKDLAPLEERLKRKSEIQSDVDCS